MRKNLFIALAVLTGLVISMTACDRLGDIEELEHKALNDIGLKTINIAAIQGVTAPAAGENPVRNIVGNDQYTGTVTWSPTPDNSGFTFSTKYTATITLTPKDGYALRMVKANFFTVAGAESVTNSANSGVITAVFPPATIGVINIATIQGVIDPIPGKIPVTHITENVQYTGTVSWSPTVSGTFAKETRYTATITITPKTGYTLKGVAENFFTVAGATTTNSKDSGVITAIFPVSEPIVLSVGVWADGTINATGEQWFKFTATANTQYIHVNFGTLTNLYVQVYDSSDNTVESKTYLDSSRRYVSLSVIRGQEYYIIIRPYYSSGNGTYRIMFNATFYPSGITQLTVNTWTNGNLPTSYDEQWFKFTATASTQYIHASFGTLNSSNADSLYVQVYDSSGSMLGSETYLYSSIRYVFLSVTSGQEYYIRVRPYSSNGTYQIGFNTTPYPPGTTITTLTANTWADGNLPTSSDEQWFKFTATANMQHIHASFGTLSSSSVLYVQVYDSSGSTLGREVYLDSNMSVSKSVTSGQEYYIRIRPYNSNGTYRIGFNTTPYPPGITITTLTANTWADGNLPTSSDEQWFEFTATASTQYIHASFGTLNSSNADSLYVQVYDSSGSTLGSETHLSIINTRYDLSVTNGQEYYIRVRSYSSNGTYRIGFNTTYFIPPDVTQLTMNNWTDGSFGSRYDEQWFKFSATASTQYIHASFGTLNSSDADGLYVQVYDSSDSLLESGTHLYSSTKNVSLSVTIGQEYYIRVQPYSGSNYIGTYQILFNATFYPSGTTQLTVNNWTDGSFGSLSDEQWFKFSATASTQYIHASFGTLNSLYGVYVQVYDSSGSTLESKNLYIQYYGTSFVSLSVTIGQEYSIRIRPYNSNGTYRIGFNTSTTPPP